MLYDYENTIDFARQQGHQTGRQEGLAEGEMKGRENKALEVAKNLISLGLTAEQIAAATGLTETQIQKLRIEIQH